MLIQERDEEGEEGNLKSNLLLYLSPTGIEIFRIVAASGYQG